MSLKLASEKVQFNENYNKNQKSISVFTPDHINQ